MKLKLDENLPRDLRARLRRLENDVSTVADERLLSQPDPVIGAAAKAEGRLLLALDVAFGRNILRGATLESFYSARGALAR